MKKELSRILAFNINNPYFKFYIIKNQETRIK